MSSETWSYTPATGSPARFAGGSSRSVLMSATVVSNHPSTPWTPADRPRWTNPPVSRCGILPVSLYQPELMLGALPGNTRVRPAALERVRKPRTSRMTEGSNMTTSGEINVTNDSGAFHVGWSTYRNLAPLWSPRGRPSAAIIIYTVTVYRSLLTKCTGRQNNSKDEFSQHNDFLFNDENTAQLNNTR